MRGWLRDLRKSKGFTEKQIAEAISVKQPVYHRYETGLGNPSVKTAKRLGVVLGFNWTKLYDDQDQKGA